MEKGLFDESSSSEVSQEGWDKMIEVWKNTVDCQKLHEDNTDVDWNEPLCFALSIAMARNQKSMDTRAPEDMSEHALAFLLERSSDNGLFPGKPDQQGSPCMYKDEIARDNLRGVTFEIPYLFWKHSSSLGVKPEIVKGSQETSPTDDTKSPSSRSSSQPEFNRKILSLLIDLTQQKREKNDKKASSSSMKHHFPFGNTIELQNIVELEDEWLYNKPLFLSQDALDMPKTTDDTPILGVVIDVPKAGKGAEARKEDSRSVKISRVSTMENLLDRRLRTPKDAKKRLWAMFSAGPDDITHCENTVGPDPITQHQMANFHQSHKSFEKHFDEETVAKLST
ncbi:hypothetical protein CABS01_09132 [Colletotrichum abscissum]|uniref:Uncharacterized protein n=1 Tax=Colletotrichum abscissum TaxID=1671311 RepID=A0A9P9X5I9_9PEZI|nr:uncharacterized protein CABS01_09132 [Colletotrichum abscissum]KAI3537466.1 hypothetical protein CABS02_12127 [Colletotrichum abscissum]KAK1503743.1 hypothetical protein CABS01_09132 [Colletotrichum abscissum]